MILTAASYDLFFNKTNIPLMVFTLDAANTPVVSIKLVVEKSLTINGSLQFSYSSQFIWNNHPISTSLWKANFQVDVDGQLLLAEWSIVNVMNATECSNGTHTFLSVSVNSYIINITGDVQLYLDARIHNQRAGYQYTASVAYTAKIRNGSFKHSPFLIVHE